MQSPINYYAHTLENQPPEAWEPLFTPFGEADSQCQKFNCNKCKKLHPHHGHLNKVAYWTARFASNIFPEHNDESTVQQWAYLTGLWHDLGKFTAEFQHYLKTASDPHSDEIAQKVDHTTAGAKHAIATSPFGHFIATAIAGHHAGLLDARHETHASLEKRLAKSFGSEIPHISAPEQVTHHPLPPLPEFIKKSDPHLSPAFFQRMLFSCLVDADFLATEAFMNPSQTKKRPTAPDQTFQRALTLLETKIHNFGPPSPDDKVAHSRATVVSDCTTAAAQPSGIFTLTVPTGGGKTLSSLNFALRHALAHGKQKIIYVIPFTSIIEQNASVFRDLLAPLGENIVLEHHSNLSPDQETETSRLAAENWDAPIIVTTAVQFYESLHACKTSRSRKIHNIANSIVILDEAQNLPITYLTPCLKTLEELTKNYQTTTVLCTATQPAVAKSEDFRIGFTNSTEIILDTQTLFTNLARVKVHHRGPLTDKTIATELSASPQNLTIVNTRDHAKNLYQTLPESAEENYHLSTLMCPEHRLQILATVRQRLTKNLSTRLISTQLIEAGVDVDFPLVYRSMAGLDSIAQAAGRCNREGKLPLGNTHVFQPEHQKSESNFAETANLGHEILDLHQKDPLSRAAIQTYFHKYYHQQKHRWDAKEIIADFQSVKDPKLPLLYQYRTASEKFNLIENTQIPIIIPWNETAKKLCDDLRTETIPLHRDLLRRLQRYTVQIYERDFLKNQHQFEFTRDAQFQILICPETHYSENFGLNLTDEAPNSNTLIC